MPTRDFAAELIAARDAGDWTAHAEIWEARRLASVDGDESSLAAALETYPPRPMSESMAADLAALADDASPHARTLATNLKALAEGSPHALAAAIASGTLLASNAGLNREALSRSVGMVAKLANDASNIAGSLNGDALRASDVQAAREIAGGMERLALALGAGDYANAYQALAHIPANARKLAEHLAESKRGHARCAASLAESDRKGGEAVREAADLAGELEAVRGSLETARAHRDAYREQRDAEGARAVAAEARADRAERQLVEYRALLAPLPFGITRAYPAALPLLRAYLADVESAS